VATTYLSFLDQLLHYLDRPHTGVPAAPVGGPAAWRGDELADDSWALRLREAQVEELRHAVTTAVANGRPLAELTVDDFPLPTLRADVDGWRTVLDEGRGFVLVRGLPVEEWSADEAEVAFWGLGLHLGRPGAQNADGDLLGHVLDLGEDANHPASRLYRTNSDIRFHCDAADVVGLLCLRTAEDGGASRLVSSVTVFDQLLTEQPELAARLFEPMKLDSRLEPGREPRYTSVQPCCFDGDRLRTFMHTEYFASVERHNGVELDVLEAAALSAWEEIAERPGVHLDMELEPGDVQLVSNHTVVHARRGYVDAADPADRRHLLRLWLSL
jgi:hypothetical protein